MIRGAHIQRAPSVSMSIDAALDRYLAEVTPTKRPSTQGAEKMRAKQLKKSLGDYSLTSLSPNIVAKYWDGRLAEGKSPSTSSLVERGLSDQEVAAISGHKSMQMLKRYTHLRAEDLVVRLDEVRRRNSS